MFGRHPGRQVRIDRRVDVASPARARARFGIPSVTREIRSIHEIFHLLFAPWKDLEDDDRMDLVRVTRVDDDTRDG